jgi:L-fucose mutarotase
VVRLGEVTVLRAAQAILSVFPLDSFIERPLERMEVDNDPAKTTPTQDAMLTLASDSEGRSLEYGIVPRLDFYDRAKSAFAVVHTLDTVPYGCFFLHKGVIFG